MMVMTFVECLVETPAVLSLNMNARLGTHLFKKRQCEVRALTTALRILVFWFSSGLFCGALK